MEKKRMMDKLAGILCRIEKDRRSVGWMLRLLMLVGLWYLPEILMMLPEMNRFVYYARLPLVQYLIAWRFDIFLFAGLVCVFWKLDKFCFSKGSKKLGVTAPADNK